LGRLFTFGCSLTEYIWPTYADFAYEALGRPNGSFNYGSPGAGNLYIFSSVLKVSEIEKINSDDIVIILWSAWYRTDCFDSVERKWLHNASPISDTFDPVSYAVRDLSLVKAMGGYLKNIGCKFYMNSMHKPFLTINAKEFLKEVPAPTADDMLFEPSLYDGWLPYSDYLDKFPLEHHRKGKEIEILQYDEHPSPYEHWDWAKKWLPPELICNREYMQTCQDRWQWVVSQADFNLKAPLFSQHHYWPDRKIGDETENGRKLAKGKTVIPFLENIIL